MQTRLRYADYYNLTSTFDELYQRSQTGENFTRLYDLIISRENILLAYRNIKRNSGAKTSGTDGKTISYLENLKDEQIVRLVRDKLISYKPEKVRRKMIPKSNEDFRPLGIPTITDRLIQQCFKQILEPITEARFYNHSYGFRPMRSTHHALARVQYLINKGKLHYVVDIDIKGFFDNINHTRLMKQLWNIGIRDKKALAIISKMLEAEIQGEGVPTKRTPQGGILSPLLANVVLNDLDQWVARQWEKFEPNFNYHNASNRNAALKKTNLKEGYIVRYADDFKVLCRDYQTAVKWFHAVRLYLKDRLKLDLSEGKSKITNLRKRKTDFLGFTIKAERKGKNGRRVAQTGVSEKKKRQIKQQAKTIIKVIQKDPNTQNALKWNGFVLGVHNYFRKATLVNLDFNRIHYDISRTMYNRLRQKAHYGKPITATYSFRKFYQSNHKTFKVAKTWLYPLTDVQTRNNMCFKQDVTPYTPHGRVAIYKYLSTNVAREINKLMNSYIPDRTIEYLDNRISRYSMKNGKCEITGIFLLAEDVHCHHYRPRHLGGGDEFNNLRIIHKDIHRLIHAKNKQTIENLRTSIQIDGKFIIKINQYRKVCNLENL
ncbi:group II intron reverse transcriptase/maturase [Bacillus thuringiensis serovar shandongiensis]|uniref:group II intron reverse transcriptase/maturase n=1 Tax=Bacillus toyonensis TaxID=155322 RepID=UPI000B449C0B|nr:group II intron reverse transcriptase/maturase [Bacillus toyonensis]MEC2394021.1 group II intron reverse transcriptase/maturase [Bacillus toyonensis]OTX33654.1 group II intron reverse transcriptase/maturase [Bacillus thuringiensis serovar malayensis]OUB08528.1 group II intron reverse transcriptase/maturase [Bacillus thuringiensis serovar shandongiensis]